MTRIYSIHLVMPFNLGIRNIPSNISTHYAYDIYPTKHITQKTRAGFVSKPQIQRKSVKDIRPLKPTEKIILGPTVEAPKPRNTFRKNIDKAALAEYFDNDVLPSHAEVAQEKLDTWLMQTAIELENADIEKAQQNVTEDEIRKFVESKSNKYTTFNFQDEDAEDDKDIEETAHNPWNKIAEYAHDLDWMESKLKVKELRLGINSVDATREDKFERLFFENEINASVADHFIKKHKGADTATALRTFDKAKRKTDINLDYMLRKLYRTK